MRLYLDEIKRPELWQLFELRVLGPILGESAPPAYAELLSKFGFATATEACSAVLSGKRIYARFLTEVVSEYASARSDTEDEITDLWQILSKSRARLDAQDRIE
jgi:hypothetical protein